MGNNTMTAPKQEDWEREFERLFVRGHAPSYLPSGEIQDADSWIEASPEDMELYISKLLKSERKKVIMECAETAKNDYVFSTKLNMTFDEIKGWRLGAEDAACSITQAILAKLEEKCGQEEA